MAEEKKTLEDLGEAVAAAAEILLDLRLGPFAVVRILPMITLLRKKHSLNFLKNRFEILRRLFLLIALALIPLVFSYLLYYS